MRFRVAAIGAALWLAAVTPAPADEAGAIIPPARQRYADEEAKEVPDFQRHILPLMGRLGCNTRSCHGSFQGAGGFRLSLFGYDFKMDHDALLKPESQRVDRETPEGSKILQKPTLGIPHKGGKRMEEEGWQYRMFVRWIEAGAKGVENPVRFERLEVVPSEVVFERAGQTVPLQVIAHWADGTSEDVTCIARFRTNDESIAEIDADGVVTSKGKGDTHVVAFYDNGVAVTQAILPVSEKVGPKYPDVPTPTKVDRLVVAKLRKLGVVPSEVCTDAEFLRRVSLDLTGTLPTPVEVETFLADDAPGKRAAKVEELLKRESYVAWWTTKLCDITGNNPRNLQLQGLSAPVARDWYMWIYKRVAENLPYDKLVAGIVLATSRKPGQDYDTFIKEQSAYYRQDSPDDFSSRHETMPYYWMKRGFQKPEERALNFSYTFLGVRLECAQCHKHPFDQWTQNDFNQFAAFFNGVRVGFAPDAQATARKMREDLKIDPKKNVQQQLAQLVRRGEVIPWQEVFVLNRPNAGRVRPKQATANADIRSATPRVLGGDEVTLAQYKDPREPLLEWMRKKDNPYFARAFINRVWANYFGSGIVNPPDDMNLANPPSNAALLDYLSDGFIAHDYDMKWLHREIVTSLAYQRSWHPNETNRLDERNFSRAVVRRLPAEVLIDAVAQATAGSDALPKMTADLEGRAIGLKGLGVGLRRGSVAFASQVFGGSTRDTNCDCSRSNEPNLLQSIYLQNDAELLNNLERADGWVAERAQAKKKGAAALARSLDDLAKRAAKLDRKDQEEPDADEAGAIDRQLDEQARKVEAERDRLRREERDPSAAAEAVVRAAYLRTVNREPSSSESAVARDYLGRAGDEAKGLRDLLWALLNTKEFITNH